MRMFPQKGFCYSVLTCIINYSLLLVVISRVRNLPEDFVPSSQPALYLTKMYSFLVVLFNNESVARAIIYYIWKRFWKKTEGNPVKGILLFV